MLLKRKYDNVRYTVVSTNSPIIFYETVMEYLRKKGSIRLVLQPNGEVAIYSKPRNKLFVVRRVLGI